MSNVGPKNNEAVVEDIGRLGVADTFAYVRRLSLGSALTFCGLLGGSFSLGVLVANLLINPSANEIRLEDERDELLADVANLSKFQDEYGKLVEQVEGLGFGSEIAAIDEFISAQRKAIDEAMHQNSVLADAMAFTLEHHQSRTQNVPIYVSSLENELAERSRDIDESRVNVTILLRNTALCVEALAEDQLDAMIRLTEFSSTVSELEGFSSSRVWTKDAEQVRLEMPKLIRYSILSAGGPCD